MKKNEKGKYRLVNVAIEIIRVIIKNINLSLSVNEFSEKFINYIITFLIDFFSDYDQIEFNERNRDLTIFHIPIGLLKMITLP